MGKEASAQQQHGESDPVAIKAEERRRRLADMMDSGTKTEVQQPSKATGKQLAHGTAVSTASQQQKVTTTEKQVGAASTAVSTATQSSVPPVELSDIESKAFALQEQVSRMVNAPNDNDNNNNKSPPTKNNNALITAKLVDDEHERKKIAKEAQEDLISKAVVASVKEEDENDHAAVVSPRCWMLIACLLVVVAAVLGGVCGSGKCSSSSAVDPVQRAAAITELVNTVTLRSTSIEYPVNATNTKAPEEQALEFLIDNDPLQLSVSSGDSSRLVQRYALAVLWYTNGPWDAIGGSPHSAWFAQSNECEWLGVECSEDGQVVQLNLDDQGMQGELPADLPLLTQMKALSLNTNFLNGTIPSFLTELGGLEKLDLEFNRFSGPGVPSFLAKLPKLREYKIGFNFLNGTLPEFLVEMKQLNTLAANFNELSGTIPEFLGDMTWLIHLALAGNGFTDSIPGDAIGSLLGLERLEVGGTGHTPGTGSLLPLSGLRELTYLSYLSAGFEGASLPDEIGDWWPNMENFFLLRSDFSGRIPASVAKWKNLKSLEMSFNKFTGPLPSGIYDAWSNLEYLNIGSCDLTGTLPETIGMWSNLQSLDIRRNAFRGTLPTTIGLMTSLRSFIVSGNQFSGSIPSEVNNLGSVNFWFDQNNFTGTAPFCAAGTPVTETIARARVDCELVLCICCSVCGGQ